MEHKEKSIQIFIKKLLLSLLKLSVTVKAVWGYVIFKKLKQ